MASNTKIRTLVRGVSTKILENYDQFHAALDRMEKYHKISNDFQVSALNHCIILKHETVHSKYTLLGHGFHKSREGSLGQCC